MRNKSSSKQSRHTSQYERPIVYDREIFIGLCRRLLLGESFPAICAKPPMPTGAVFLAWIQDHKEAREIDRSAQNFQFDRARAKELGVPLCVSISEWEAQVRANCKYGWPADRIDRGYIPPDWNKVYPWLGEPLVLSTENRQAYDDLIDVYTKRFEPRDEMELIWTKQAVDAMWEALRIARGKTDLMQRKYQQRLQLVAQFRPRTGAVESSLAKSTRAPDFSVLLEVDPEYQALDRAQSRVMKRHEKVLREIAHYRRGLGATPRALPHRFVDEQILAQRYGLDRYGTELEDAENDTTTGKAVETAFALAIGDETTQPVSPLLAPTDKAAEALPVLAPSDTAAHPAPVAAPPHKVGGAAPPILAPSDQVGAAAPHLAPADESAQPPSPITSSGEPVHAVPRPAPAVEAAQPAPPPLAPFDTSTKAEPPDGFHSWAA